MKITAQIFVAAACISFFGCRPTSDKVPKAGDQPVLQAQAGSSARGVDTNNRAAAQQKLSRELNELDTKMADLKARAQNAGAQAKAEWEARRPQLEAQRDAAAKKLDELTRSSKEAWEQTRARTEAAFTELEKGFKEAWAKLKE